MKSNRLFRTWRVGAVLLIALFSSCVSHPPMRGVSEIWYSEDGRVGAVLLGNTLSLARGIAENGSLAGDSAWHDRPKEIYGVYGVEDDALGWDVRFRSANCFIMINALEEGVMEVVGRDGGALLLRRDEAVQPATPAMRPIR